MLQLVLVMVTVFKPYDQNNTTDTISCSNHENHPQSLCYCCPLAAS